MNWLISKKWTACLITSILLFSTTVAQTSFSNIGPSAGVNAYHITTNEQLGGGVALFDFNNDDLVDILYTGGNNVLSLYQNFGNDSFVNVSVSAGLSAIDGIPIHGVVTGDINNDGFRDVFLYSMKDFRNCLLYNNGNGTFTDITFTAGLEGDSSWSFSATFADVNRDGFIDLYVGGFVDIPRSLSDSIGQFIGFAHTCYANNLFINNGDGTFRDESVSMQIGDTGCTLSSLFTDYDNDGDVDILNVNDFGAWVHPNSLFQNNYPDPFFNIADSVGIDVPIYGMGVAAGDYDKDMDIDYYFTNIGRNVLSMNLGNGFFMDTTNAANVSSEWVVQDTFKSTGWGCGFIDIDNDSYLDLYVANGHIGAFPELQTSLIDPDHLYRNNGDGTFTDISTILPQDSSATTRGFAYADYDNDGDIDLFPVTSLVTSSDPIRMNPLLKNQLNNGNHWLKINLTGTVSNADAFGSQILIYVDQQSWIHEVSGQGSHCSQHSTIAHFGLDTSQIVDSVIIKWPSGHIDKLYSISADQLLHIHEGLTGPIQVQILSTITSAPCSNASTLIYSNGIFADYIWSTGDTTSSVSVNSSDTYYVTATDHNGYISYDSIFILLDYNDSLIIQYTDVLCHGASNGTASVQYQGATGIIDYNWSTGSTSSTLTGLQPGSYSVSVLNSTGCPDSASVQISTPSQLSLQESLQQIACFGDSSGSINLSIQGGTPPYSYNWSNAMTTEDIDQLPMGNYSVFILDSLGCDLMASYFIYSPLSQVQATSSDIDSICIGSANGSISLNTTGGTPPYSYQWMSGETSQQITNLGVGIYEVTITDDLDCEFVYNDTISYYPSIDFQIDIEIDSNTGFGNVLVSNQGTSLLFYTWSTNSVDSIQSNLAPGNYMLNIQDEYGCSLDTIIHIPLIQSISFQTNPFVKLYPNPAQQAINIEFVHPSHELETISIYATDGRCLKTKRIKTSLNNSIDISDFPEGVYFLRMHSKPNTAILPFCKT